MSNKVSSQSMAKDTAAKLSTFVNVMGNDPFDLANEIVNDHRYLQQEIFNMFLHCVGLWAKEARTGRFDTRNEIAVKCSEKILQTLISEGVISSKYLEDN